MCQKWKALYSTLAPVLNLPLRIGSSRDVLYPPIDGLATQVRVHKFELNQKLYKHYTHSIAKGRIKDSVHQGYTP